MDEPFVIWSFEHDAWWRPKRWGYTRELAEAGVYSAEESRSIVARANLITVNEQAIPLEQAARFVPPASFCCPWCRRRSFNPHDIRERYCGACHAFTEDDR
jgi:hypothetical protein